jgi:hypothetical protein
MGGRTTSSSCTELLDMRNPVLTFQTSDTMTVAGVQCTVLYSVYSGRNLLRDISMYMTGLLIPLHGMSVTSWVCPG